MSEAVYTRSNGVRVAVADMAEEWRVIPGYDGRYEVSTFGRVLSRFFKTPRPMAFVWSKKGYPNVKLCSPRGQDHWIVPRLVLTVFVGPCPEGKEAAHEDSNTANSRLDNLTWKTPVENAADKLRVGTLLVGSRHQNAKLTEAQVAAIRATHAPGTAVAAKYGVSQSLISQLRNGKGWSHV